MFNWFTSKSLFSSRVCQFLTSTTDIWIGGRNRSFRPTPRKLIREQASEVDVKNWQTRDENNDLEVNQIQVSSLIVLTHIENVSEERKNFVIKELNKFNPTAEILMMNEIDVTLLPKLLPSKNKFQKFDHLKAHWSSCSIDLPLNHYSHLVFASF